MSGALIRMRCPPGEEQVGDDVALVFRLFGVVPVGWKYGDMIRIPDLSWA